MAKVTRESEGERAALSLPVTSEQLPLLGALTVVPPAAPLLATGPSENEGWVLVSGVVLTNPGLNKPPVLARGHSHPFLFTPHSPLPRPCDTLFSHTVRLGFAPRKFPALRLPPVLSISEVGRGVSAEAGFTTAPCHSERCCRRADHIEAKDARPAMTATPATLKTGEQTVEIKLA